MRHISVIRLYRLHIKNTEEKQPVADRTTLLCTVTNVVKKVCLFKTSKIYVNTKALKHLYDKKPAQEFNFIIRNIHTIVKYPDHIYNNKSSKRGDYIFTKLIKKDIYLCSVEIVDNASINGYTEHANFVVTCFKVRDKKYLKKYDLMWSWKGGDPSS